METSDKVTAGIVAYLAATFIAGGLLLTFRTSEPTVQTFRYAAGSTAMQGPVGPPFPALTEMWDGTPKPFPALWEVWGELAPGVREAANRG